MTDLDSNSFQRADVDHDEISRMIDDLFVSEGAEQGRWTSESLAAPRPVSADGPADQDRKRAVRAFGHQIRLTRRSAGYRTTGDLAFAMRTMGVKITGATIGNWERGFVLPNPSALAVAEQALRSDGMLADTLAELVGNDEAAIEPETVDAAPDVHTRLRIEDLENRVADLEDEVSELRGGAASRSDLPAVITASAVPAPAARSWLARLRTAPTHHHSVGASRSHGGSGSGYDRRPR